MTPFVSFSVKVTFLDVQCIFVYFENCYSILPFVSISVQQLFQPFHVWFFVNGGFQATISASSFSSFYFFSSSRRFWCLKPQAWEAHVDLSCNLVRNNDESLKGSEIVSTKLERIISEEIWSLISYKLSSDQRKQRLVWYFFFCGFVLFLEISLSGTHAIKLPENKNDKFFDDTIKTIFSMNKLWMQLWQTWFVFKNRQLTFDDYDPNDYCSRFVRRNILSQYVSLFRRTTQSSL